MHTTAIATRKQVVEPRVGPILQNLAKAWDHLVQAAAATSSPQSALLPAVQVVQSNGQDKRSLQHQLIGFRAGKKTMPEQWYTRRVLTSKKVDGDEIRLSWVMLRLILFNRKIK